MKLLAPVLGSYTITQKFGGNSNPLYASQGLLGHPALDIWKGYDSYIVASHECYVYKIINKDNPDLSKYRAVHTLFQDEENWYELVYGHCNKTYARVGDTVPAGSLLASMGNTGAVYYQGIQVPISQRSIPPYPGTHLHWQLRRVLLSPQAVVGKRYLDVETPTGQRQDSLYQDKQGNFYEIPDYENGYYGCIDPLPYLYQPTLWEQLKIGANILLYEQAKLKAA